MRDRAWCLTTNTGGAGTDQFWIADAELPEAANTITDFMSGVDERYPMADKIGVIQDQLNTHVKASLDKAFPPKKRNGFWTN